MSKTRIVLVTLATICLALALINFVPLVYRLQYCAWNNCTIDMALSNRLVFMFFWAIVWGSASLGLIGVENLIREDK